MGMEYEENGFGEDGFEADGQEEMSAGSVTFKVKMTTGILYDYMLHHAYSGAGAILGTCFGILGVVAFTQTRYPLYLVLGIMLIFYLPLTLAQRAVNQMANNPAFKEPLEYTLDQNGITVRQGSRSENIGWDKCTKATSTRQSIILYTGKNNASILPRKDLGEHTLGVLSVISKYVDPKKVKIRY